MGKPGRGGLRDSGFADRIALEAIGIVKDLSFLLVERFFGNPPPAGRFTTFLRRLPEKLYAEAKTEADRRAAVARAWVVHPDPMSLPFVVEEFRRVRIERGPYAPLPLPKRRKGRPSLSLASFIPRALAAWREVERKGRKAIRYARKRPGSKSSRLEHDQTPLVRAALRFVEFIEGEELLRLIELRIILCREIGRQSIETATSADNKGVVDRLLKLGRVADSVLAKLGEARAALTDKSDERRLERALVELLSIRYGPTAPLNHD